MGSVLCFGEILWDIFADKQQIGGAPLNFAAHFAKLGGRSAMLSAVGRDELGDRAIEIVNGFGVDTSMVARVDLPTGRCNVTLKDGSPSYELVYPVAYDAIPYAEHKAQFDALYFGTLACRDQRSFETLKTLIKKADTKERFFDVNIRQSYYSIELINELASQATVLKVSREEIGVFDMLGETDAATAAEMLLCRYKNLRMVAVTLDKDGAMIAERGKEPIFSRKPTGKVVSTVGGGDSFSACLLASLLCGMSAETALERAVTLSDYVVTQLGAIPEYSEELNRRLFG